MEKLHRTAHSPLITVLTSNNTTNPEICTYKKPSNNTQPLRSIHGLMGL